MVLMARCEFTNFFVLVGQWTIFKKRKLKASDPDNLNDPFDFLAVDMTDSGYRADVCKRVQLVLSDRVMCCFSDAATNPLLRAHYSDYHKGICLGFEINDSIAGRMKKVTYVEKRLAPDQVRDKDDVPELLFLKFSAWSYEGEVRAFLPRVPAAAGELTFIEFDDDLVLKEVILGHKCTTSVAEVKSKLVGCSSNVTVRRACPSLSDFTMNIEMESNTADPACLFRRVPETETY